MPFFTAAHLERALAYCAENTHPSLVSFLAMVRTGLPVEAMGVVGENFGSMQENDLLDLAFTPPGGTAERPYYQPFGPGRVGDSRWKPKNYAGTTLQRMRSSKPFVYHREGKGPEALWWLAQGYQTALQTQQPEVLGTRPLSIHNLAVWLYRTEDFASHQAAIQKFVAEFQLVNYGLVATAFADTEDPDLAVIALAAAAMTAADIEGSLEIIPVPVAVAAPAGGAGAAGIPQADAEPPAPEDVAVHVIGSWDVGAAQLEEAMGPLRGLEEAVLQGLAALRAGMHVVFTGAPGSGKTELAKRICDAGGFQSWLVTATDHWTTFETIGGYFPDPEGRGEGLDFLPGVVVSSIQQGRVLIIDEINRADIDKAFGELFTLLSGTDVDLPYQKRGDEEGAPRKRIRLVIGDRVPEPDVETIKVPSRWRIIGAMNDADKASLKRLSFAFVRRFAFIPVPLPTPADYEALIDAAAGEGPGSLGHERPGFVTALKHLFANPAGLRSIEMAMGFAIPKAMLRQAIGELALDPARTDGRLLLSCLALYVAPQFQGRADRHGEFLTLLSAHLNADEQAELDTSLANWTGFIH